MVQLDGMYQLEKYGSAPKGLIVKSLDTVLVSSAIIMEIPMADHADPQFYAAVQNGDWVRLDATTQTVEIIRQCLKPYEA